MTGRLGALTAGALLLAACGTQGRSAEARVDSRPAAGDPSGSAAATSAAPGAQSTTIDKSNGSVATVLRDIFVRAGTIDGRRIIGFRLTDRCTTAFETPAGTTTIDWRHVGNFAGRQVDDRETFAIADGRGKHDIAVPAGQQPEPLGDARARVDSGFGSLADGCNPG